MKILVLGAGRMGHGAVFDLIHNSPDIERVTVADFDLAKAESVVSAVDASRGNARQIDASNYTDVVALSQGTLAVSSAVVTGALCGNPTGAVDITPTGGTPPYSYLWSNGATTQDISGVVSGNYTLDLSDSMGCLNSSSYTVPLTSALSIIATYFQDETCSQVDGFIQVDVVGGDSN